MRVLALITEAFGGHGGIALYNRDLLTALCELADCEEVVAVPRLMPSPPEPMPEKLTYLAGGAGGKLSYLRQVARLLATDRKFDLIICGHINLLPLVEVARLVIGAPRLLFIYGIDAWKPTPSALANRLVKRVDGFVSISDFTRRKFLSWSGVEGRRGHLLPNAIHLENYAPAAPNSELVARYGLEGKKVLMTLGRLLASERYKGVDEILEIMPELLERQPNLRYLVVGDGDDLPRLRSKAEAFGIAEAVVFAGRIPEQEKADHYRLADAYAMPGRGEGFGFVFLEAMACGIPVVASELDGSREAVRDGALGRTVNPDDRHALVTSIAEALQQPKAIPEHLDYFAFPSFVDRLTGIIQQPAFSRS